MCFEIIEDQADIAIQMEAFTEIKDEDEKW